MPHWQSCTSSDSPTLDNESCPYPEAIFRKERLTYIPRLHPIFSSQTMKEIIMKIQTYIPYITLRSPWSENAFPLTREAYLLRAARSHLRGHISGDPACLSYLALAMAIYVWDIVTRLILELWLMAFAVKQRRRTWSFDQALSLAHRLLKQGPRCRRQTMHAGSKLSPGYIRYAVMFLLKERFIKIPLSRMHFMEIVYGLSHQVYVYGLSHGAIIMATPEGIDIYSTPIHWPMLTNFLQIHDDHILVTVILLFIKVSSGHMFNSQRPTRQLKAW